MSIPNAQKNDGPLPERNNELARWADPHLDSKDLVAIDVKDGTKRPFFAAIRRLAKDQYAIMDFTVNRYKVVSSLQEAIAEYYGRVSLAFVSEWRDKGVEHSDADWGHKLMDHATLNRELAHWDTSARTYLCEGTKNWTKEERGRRLAIVGLVLGLLFLPMSYFGVDLRPLLVLGSIGLFWSWLSVKG